MEPIVIVHGGAGDVEDCRLEATMNGIKLAALEGYRALVCTGSTVDAVETAIKVLEDNRNFNAGKGSVLNIEGNVEMESSIMKGKDLSAGGVCVVKDIANPISLARMVMEKTSEMMLGDGGTAKFAADNGIPTVPSGTLVVESSKKDLQKFKESGTTFVSLYKKGTVGACAIDRSGNLCAGTSTGGLTGKMEGRVADTSCIGGGTYADNHSGAISCTGFGENILKFALAHKISRELERGRSVISTTKKYLDKLTQKMKTTAGVIAISRLGDVGVNFNTPRMPWAYVKGNEIHFGVERGQHEVECIKKEND